MLTFSRIHSYKRVSYFFLRMQFVGRRKSAIEKVIVKGKLRGRQVQVRRGVIGGSGTGCIGLPRPNPFF